MAMRIMRTGLERWPRLGPLGLVKPWGNSDTDRQDRQTRAAQRRRDRPAFGNPGSLFADRSLAQKWPRPGEDFKLRY